MVFQSVEIKRDYENVLRSFKYGRPFAKEKTKLEKGD
jgi:hypothetical protein